MNVCIEGTDIDRRLIEGVSLNDCAGGQADDCEITLRDAGIVGSWGFVEGENVAPLAVEVSDGGFTTGRMTLYSVQTQEGRAILRSTSLPREARSEGWNCYENVSLGNLLRIGAREMGLSGARLYGVQENTLLRRIVRRGQSWPEFLSHAMTLEGAALKLDGGTLLAIDYRVLFTGDGEREVLEAEERPRLFFRPKLRFLQVRTGLVSASAEDISVAGSMSASVTGEQVYTREQAMRAARGLLFARNLEACRYVRDIELNTGLAAMSRVHIPGSGAASGDWFIWRCTHDLIRRRTTLEMRRAITTIRA